MHASWDAFFDLRIYGSRDASSSTTGKNRKNTGKKHNFPFFSDFVICGSKMGSLGLGRWLERLVEVLRFVVTEFRGVGSHEDPIRDQNYDSRSI